MLFLVKKENCLLCKMTKVTLTKLEKGGIFPSLTVMFGKNTAERLILYSFSGGAFSFCDKFIVCFNPGLFFCPSHNVISCRTVFNQQFF